jgi:arginyl-tRNA synthetase
MRIFTFIIAVMMIATTAHASLIPQAMKWKYGANCTDNKEGTDIGIWESQLPRPGKKQIESDVREYQEYLVSINNEVDEIDNEEEIFRGKIAQLAIDSLKKDNVTLKHEDKLVIKFKENKK